MAIDNVFHIYKDFYYKLPHSVRKFLGGVYGGVPLSLRFGKHYDYHKNVVASFLEKDKAFQLDFIFNKTYETLAFAEQHIEYYKNKFAEYGVTIADLKSLEDVSRFPSLTKEDIKKNLNQLYVGTVEKPIPCYTGGSTSSPTKYFLPFRSSRAKEKAYNNHLYFRHVGYQYRDRALLLKGRDVASIESDIFWEYEPVDNYLAISANHVSPQYISTIFSEVKYFSPKYIFGYPSAVLDFIRACEANAIFSLNVDGVVLASEMVFPQELEKIASFFNCSVMSHYGHSERAVLATRLDTDEYRFELSYGLSRIVDSEIVCTSFDNFVMPFINYQTNDFVLGKATFIDESDVACSVESIEGRIQEYLVTGDNRLVSICVMGAGHYASLAAVETMQYQQSIPGNAVLLVQSSQKIDIELIKNEIEAFIDNAIIFEIRQVENIPKSSRGKRIMCIQSIDIETIRAVQQAALRKAC